MPEPRLMTLERLIPQLSSLHDFNLETFIVQLLFKRVNKIYHINEFFFQGIERSFEYPGGICQPTP